MSDPSGIRDFFLVHLVMSTSYLLHLSSTRNNRRLGHRQTGNERSIPLQQTQLAKSIRTAFFNLINSALHRQLLPRPTPSPRLPELQSLLLLLSGPHKQKPLVSLFLCTQCLDLVQGGHRIRLYSLFTVVAVADRLVVIPIRTRGVSKGTYIVEP